MAASYPTSGAAPNGRSHGSVLTPDARFAAFVSAASNLVQGDTNGIADNGLDLLKLLIAARLFTLGQANRYGEAQDLSAFKNSLFHRGGDGIFRA